MKYIEKQFKDQRPPEPPSYTAWKNQENAALEAYYQSNDASAAWDHLHSSSPKNEEHGIVYFTKKELLDRYLIVEQGSICAYCNRRIHNNSGDGITDTKASIEHIAAKSANPREHTHNYQNLVVVCRGGEKIPPPREIHCDLKRNNSPLPLHPLMPVCEDEIIYIYDGQIVGLTDRAETAIKVLGLENSVLKKYRETEIKKWIFDIDDNGQSIRISDDIAAQRFGECSAKNSENQFPEFCGPILSVLKNEFNI